MVGHLRQADLPEAVLAARRLGLRALAGGEDEGVVCGEDKSAGADGDGLDGKRQLGLGVIERRGVLAVGPSNFERSLE